MPRNEVFDRDEVIESAMNLFWKKGFNGTSMQDLVDATGLGRSSIYNSFGSKMDFYLTALNRYNALNAEDFRKALLDSSDPLEAIENIFYAVLAQTFKDDESKGCFIVNCKTEMFNADTGINRWLASNQEDSLNMFEELVKKGQYEGLINKNGTAKDYAYYLYSNLQGLRVSSISIKNHDILDSIIKNSLATLST
ncbi:MAG: TetR/AcrR family transcriptional regulator [Bacteroidota bacterium]